MEILGKPYQSCIPKDHRLITTRNGWGASAIDGLDTAIVMQLPEIVDFILEYVPSIDFAITTTQSRTLTQVSLFETTIRYLGGMLAAYDLLKGPLAFVASNTTAVDALLAQSKALADNLKFAFDSPTGIPSNNLYLETRTTDGSTTNGLATIGTLVLEWTHLSDLTGDPEYAELSQKGESYLLNPKFQSPLSEPFPGLLGTNVNITTGLFEDVAGGWNGGDDSYYEYLIKMWVYDSSRFSTYRDHWIQAADSSIAYLASHPSSRPDLTFLAAFDGTQLQYNSGHRKYHISKYPRLNTTAENNPQ
jgi:mannosyl-oligosaccharide alpha-1,2-mannosidase